MSLVEQLREEFSEHDVFLQLLLGLISVSRRSERLLPPAPPAPPQGLSPEMDAEEERRVMLLLGVLSVRRSLMGKVEPLRAAPSASGATQAEAAPGGRPLGFDLLR